MPSASHLLTVGKVAKKFWAQQKQSAPGKCSFKLGQVWQILNEKGELAGGNTPSAKNPHRTDMASANSSDQAPWERALHFPLSVACRHGSSGPQINADTREPVRVSGVSFCKEPRQARTEEIQSPASVTRVQTRLRNVTAIQGKMWYAVFARLEPRPTRASQASHARANHGKFREKLEAPDENVGCPA